MPEQKSAGGRAFPSFFEHASGWLGTVIAHLRVRLQLAGIEGREAAVHYGVLLALAVAGLIFVVFGYLFFCLALVFLIARISGDENAWIWVSFGMAVLHLAAGAGAFLWIKLKITKPMFAATFDELRKDQEWLTATTENPR